MERRHCGGGATEDDEAREDGEQRGVDEGGLVAVEGEDEAVEGVERGWEEGLELLGLAGDGQERVEEVEVDREVGEEGEEAEEEEGERKIRRSFAVLRMTLGGGGVFG